MFSQLLAPWTQKFTELQAPWIFILFQWEKMQRRAKKMRRKILFQFSFYSQLFYFTIFFLHNFLLIILAPLKIECQRKDFHWNESNSLASTFSQFPPTRSPRSEILWKWENWKRFQWMENWLDGIGRNFLA